MRVLLVGHWDLTAPDLSGGAEQAEDWMVGAPGASRDVLEAVKSGLIAGAGTDVEVDLQVLGPGEAFEEATADNPTWEAVSLSRSEPNADAAANLILQAGRRGRPVLVEAGHSQYHDWGLNMLGALAGVPELGDSAGTSLGPAVDPQTLTQALDAAAEALAGAEVVVAASTDRPLVGVGATSALLPDLSERAAQGPAAGFAKDQAAYTTALNAMGNRRTGLQLDLTPRSGGAASLGATAPAKPSTDATSLAGSGAGGGAASVLAALGARVLPTAEALATLLDLPARIGQADLVVIVEPRLDAPDLAEAPLESLAVLAGTQGKPVVAAGARTSLSRPERADRGIHGVSTLNPRLSGLDSFHDLGRRLGQTWARDPS